MTSIEAMQVGMLSLLLFSIEVEDTFALVMCRLLSFMGAISLIMWQIEKWLVA